MMKPDTPKFAEMPEEIWTLDGRLVQNINDTITQTIGTYISFEVSGKSQKYIRADLAAAPKPDCVGVEEIEGMDYLAVAERLADEIPLIGVLEDDEKAIFRALKIARKYQLLAVKEKAQEGEIEGPDCEPRTAAEMPGLHKLLTEPGVLEKAKENNFDHIDVSYSGAQTLNQKGLDMAVNHPCAWQDEETKGGRS